MKDLIPVRDVKRKLNLYFYTVQHGKYIDRYSVLVAKFGDAWLRQYPLSEVHTYPTKSVLNPFHRYLLTIQQRNSRLINPVDHIFNWIYSLICRSVIPVRYLPKAKRISVYGGYVTTEFFEIEIEPALVSLLEELNKKNEFLLCDGNTYNPLIPQMRIDYLKEISSSVGDGMDYQEYINEMYNKVTKDLNIT